MSAVFRINFASYPHRHISQSISASLYSFAIIYSRTSTKCTVYQLSLYKLYAYPTMMRRSSFFLSISPLRIKLTRSSGVPLNNNNNNYNNNDNDNDNNNSNNVFIY